MEERKMLNRPPVHRLDARYFTGFPIDGFSLTTTLDLRRNGRALGFDFARTDGKRLHLWKEDFYIPHPDELKIWDGSPDIGSLLKMKPVAGMNVSMRDFLRFIPTNRKARENSILIVIFGDKILDLELIDKENHTVLIPREEPPFKVIEEGWYNPEYVFSALCGMNSVLRVSIAKLEASNSKFICLVLSSKNTLAFIANIDPRG